MNRRLIICVVCLAYLSFFLGPSSAQGFDPLTGIITAQKSVQIQNVTPASINLARQNLSFTSMGNLSINGTKFNDLNGDGFRTKDEPGLPGWTIILKRGGEEILRTTTNDKGQYSFENLVPGKYAVTEYIISGWNQTRPGGGSYDINLTNKDAYGYDFGNHFGPVTYVRKQYPIISAESWAQRNEAIKNLPKAGINPKLRAGLRYPSSFSLLSHIPYTANERDQGNCGNCWVWGCTAPIEVAHDIQDGVFDRLSIQFLNSNYNGGTGAWACCGGWEVGFQNFYSSQGKFIPWSNSNANFQDGGRGCSDGTSVPASSISTSLKYQITSIQWHEIQTIGVSTNQAISNIKSYLYANKAVTLSFYLPDFTPFWNFWGSNSGKWDPDSYCGLSNGAYPGGHEVTVVGWDDSTDSWIVLNSWGVDSAHPDGTYKLKMHMNYNCTNPGRGQSYSFGYFDVAFSGGPTDQWSTLLGGLISTPSAIKDNQGRNHVFAIGADNGLWDNVDGTWSGYGGYLTSAPFATKDSTGRIHVFARGGDNALWDKIIDTSAGTSQPWKYLGGRITTMSTAATAPSGNLIKIAARGGDNGLWICDLDTNTLIPTWHGYSGGLSTIPYVIFDASSTPQWHVYVVAPDNALWSNDGGLWTYLNGYLSSAPVATIEPGYPTMHAIVARGGDNALWMLDHTAGSASGTWYRLGGGVLAYLPFVTSDTSGKIHTFALGNDASLWENTFSSSPWNPSGAQWYPHGGGNLNGPQSIIDTNTKVYVIGGDNALWRDTFTTTSASLSGGQVDQKVR